MFKRKTDDTYYQYCPNCYANLTLQKGYSNRLPFWLCTGCREMLINPDVKAEDYIVWLCDKCGNMLNIQEGFLSDCGSWACQECGFINSIDPTELYETEDEFLASRNNPYKGLTDYEVLELSLYEEITTINNHENVILVRNTDTGLLYVKKYLKEYNLDIYKYLMENPIMHMPCIIKAYEGTNNLVIIEEYLKGKTLDKLIEEGYLLEEQSIEIIKSVCRILMDLHSGERSIVHRDIKPDNIIISDNGDVYLLDVNVAKWYEPEEVEDTKLFGTMYYAAPEQFGYGFSASSEKSDIYAVGILFNVLITGKLPKVEKANGQIWSIIEKCICLESEERYTAAELFKVLERL